MAGRVFYYDGQVVDKDDLNTSNDRLEQADRDIVADLAFTGVISGMEVVQNGTPNKTVRVNAGLGYSRQTGERVFIPALSPAVNLTSIIDAINFGNAVVVTIYARYRADTEELVNVGGVDTIIKTTESYEIVVVEGAEDTAGLEVPPADTGDDLLLADITLTSGMTEVLDADIDAVTRRSYGVNVSAGSVSIQVGTVAEALQDIVEAVDGVQTGLDAIAIDSGTYDLTMDDIAPAEAIGSQGFYMRVGERVDLIYFLIFLNTNGAIVGNTVRFDLPYAVKPGAGLGVGNIKIGDSDWANKGTDKTLEPEISGNGVIFERISSANVTLGNLLINNVAQQVAGRISYVTNGTKLV